MNQTQYRTGAIQQPVSAVAMNKVLRNTYALLSMTLLFSAIMAGVSMNFDNLKRAPGRYSAMEVVRQYGRAHEVTNAMATWIHLRNHPTWNGR